jgi:glycine cleavage system protein P-like pyridoxal-binding family
VVKGGVAHEFIFDMRCFKSTAGVEVEDLAKRLMIMVFMLNREKNILKNAPHTAEMVIAAQSDFPCSREKAAFPAHP